jgi:hypothetical protein
MKLLTKIRRWTWELPQTLIGACMYPFYKKRILKTVEYGDTKVHFVKYFPGGISLGYYVYISWDGKSQLNNSIKKNTIKHECLGHGTQSKWLGPLYLIIIGIPSIIWAGLYGSIIPYTRNGYYKFYTEKSADKLAGVIRK